MLCCKLGQQAGLIHSMRQWFLDIHMLTSHNSLGCNDSMCMVRRSDHHCISLVKKFCIHDLVIIVPFGIRITFENMGCVLPVHVAQTDDFLCFEFLENRCPSSADSNSQDLEFSVKRLWHCIFLLGPSHQHRWSDGKSKGGCRTYF